MEEDLIEQLRRRRRRPAEVSVDCPDGEEAEEGNEFDCTLTAPNGDEAIVNVTITDGGDERRGSLVAGRATGSSLAELDEPADQLDELGREPSRASPRRTGGCGVVLDPELDRLRDVARRRSARRELQRHVDSRGDAGGGDHLAVDDHPLGDRLGAVLAQLRRDRPSGWSRACPRAGRRRRAPASRCRPRSSRSIVSCAARSQSSTSSSSSSGAVALAAGDQRRCPDRRARRSRGRR